MTNQQAAFFKVWLIVGSAMIVAIAFTPLSAAEKGTLIGVVVALMAVVIVAVARIEQ